MQISPTTTPEIVLRECITKNEDSRSQVLQGFKEGRSLAIIGGAGSGKTFLLNELLRHAAKASGAGEVVACATTNNAANRIGGCTLHSLFRAKPAWEWSKQELWKEVCKSHSTVDRLMRIRTLAIDEVSLLKDNEIESIDFVLRKLAHSEEESSLPLGGRQLVVVGDPFQLEPVKINDNGSNFKTFFQSRVWFLCFTGYGTGLVIITDDNYRQCADASYFALLQRLRYGMSLPIDIFNLNRTSTDDEGVLRQPPRTHTRLCLTKAAVAKINTARLREIDSELFVFHAEDRFKDNSISRHTSMKRLDEVACATVELKKDCLVLITRKCCGLLPGTKCIVAGIIHHQYFRQTRLRLRVLEEERKTGIETVLEKEIGVCEFEIHSFNRKVIATRLQLPLLVAYAMTVHRSQGFDLDSVALDFNDINWKLNGMVYVALSRCKTMSGLWIRGLRPELIQVSQRARSTFKGIQRLGENLPDRVIGIQALRRYVERTEMNKSCLYLLQTPLKRGLQDTSSSRQLKLSRMSMDHSAIRFNEYSLQCDHDEMSRDSTNNRSHMHK